jgi:hypothetical protein
MRTALTTDDDETAHPRQIHRREARSLKEIVNDALRRGLREMDEPSSPRIAACVNSLDLGRCLVGSIDNLSEVLAVAEGPAFT